MTKKEWHKLKLQVVLRKTIPSELILLKTGWCHKCKNYKGKVDIVKAARIDCYHYRQQRCKGIIIPTITSRGTLEDYWYTYYYPKEFSDD